MEGRLGVARHRRLLVAGPRRRPAPALACDEHLAHQLLAVLAEEHVLGTAESDPLGAERACPLGVLGEVRVRAHAEPADLVGPAEHLVELLADPGRDQLDLVLRHEPGRAVDGDPIARRDLGLPHLQDPVGGVDFEVRGAGDAGPAHAPGDQRRVRGLAALGGEDSPRGVKAGDVLSLGEPSHEDHVVARLRPLHGLVGGEHHRALRRARRGRHPPGELGVLVVRVERGVQERLQRPGVDRRDRRLAVEQPLVNRVAREPHRGLGGALGGSRLQQEELAVLDRELDVLHVPVVALERLEHLHQLRVHLRQPLREAVEPVGVADPRDHVLALGVEEEIPGRLGRAGGLVA